MIALAFILPVCAAFASMGLSRFVPTRILSFACAGVLAVAALLLGIVRPDLRPIVLLDTLWFDLAERSLRLVLRIDTLAWQVGALALAGMALTLALLGLVLPADLRGFGALPAALGFTAVATLAGAANGEMLLEPVAWMLATLTTAISLRSSGALPNSDAPLIVVLAGASAAVLLIGGMLFSAETVGRLVCLIIACLLILGAAPFNDIAGAIGEAPAGLGSALLAFGLPLLGGTTIVRAAASLPPAWSAGLTVIGLLNLVACAAGAIGERQARRRIAWQHGALQGLFLVVTMQQPAVGALLMLGIALTTCLVGFAVALIERRTGTDDLAIADLRIPSLLVGLAMSTIAVVMIGAAAWFGSQALYGGAVWGIGPLLLGLGLLLVSYITPAAILIRGSEVAPLVAHEPNEVVSGVALPSALAESVAGLAWIAAPAAVLNTLWLILLRSGEVLTRLFAYAEGRYYMAGLIAALIVVTLLFLATT
jgi:hypothetical protein